MLARIDHSLTPPHTTALFTAMSAMASLYMEAACKKAVEVPAFTQVQRDILADLSPALGCEQYWKTLAAPTSVERHELVKASMHMAEGIRQFLNLKQFEESPHLKTGDWVFVAGTGLCQVVGKEERVLRGKTCTFFVFEYTWPTSNTKIRVIKSEETLASLIRPLAPLEEYARALKNLDSTRKDVEAKNQSHFQKTCLRLYQQGSPEVLALLLSHLAPYVRRKTIEISESTILFRKVLASLSGEIALASSRPHEDVIREILTTLDLADHPLLKITSHVKRSPQPPQSEAAKVIWTYGSGSTMPTAEVEALEAIAEIKEETPSETIEDAVMQVPLKVLIRVEDILPGDTYASLKDYLKCFRLREVDRDKFKRLVGVSVETAQTWGKGSHQPERSAYILKLFRFLVTQHLRDDEKVPDLLDLWMLAYPKAGKVLKKTMHGERYIIPMKELVLSLPLRDLTYDNALTIVTSEVHPKLLVDGVKQTAGIQAVSPETVKSHREKLVAASAAMGTTKDTMGAILGIEAEAFFMLDHLTLGVPVAVGDFKPQEPALGRLTRYTICLANAEDDWELYYKFRDTPDRETFPFLYIHQTPDPFAILMGELEARISLLESIQQSTPGFQFTISKVAGTPPKPELLRRRLQAFRMSHADMQRRYAAYEANPTALPMNTLSEMRQHYRRLMRFARSLRDTWAVSGNLKINATEAITFEIAPDTEEGLLPHQAAFRERKMIVPSQAFEIWHEVMSPNTDTAISTDRFLKLHLSFIQLSERGVVTEKDIPALAKNILGSPCDLDVVAYKKFRVIAETYSGRSSLDAGYTAVQEIYDEIGYEKKPNPQKAKSSHQPLIDVVRDYLGLDDDNTRRIAQVVEAYLDAHAEAKTSFDLQKLNAAIKTSHVSETSLAASIPLLNTVLGYLKMKTQEQAPIAAPPLPAKPERPVQEIITFPRTLDENHLVSTKVSRLATYHLSHTTDFTEDQKEEVAAILALVASRFERPITMGKKVEDAEVSMALSFVRKQRSLFLGLSVDLDVSKLNKIIFSFLRFLRNTFESERKTGPTIDKSTLSKASDGLLFHCIAGTKTTTLEDICLSEADTSKGRHQTLVRDGVATLTTWLSGRQESIHQDISDFHDFFAMFLQEDLTGVHQGNAEDFLRKQNVIEGPLQIFLTRIETRGLLYLDNTGPAFSIRKAIDDFISKLPPAPAIEKATEPVKSHPKPPNPPRNSPIPRTVAVTERISESEKRVRRWIESLGGDAAAIAVVSTYPELHSFATWDKGLYAMRGFASAAEREQAYNPDPNDLRQYMLKHDMSGNEADSHFKRKQLVQKLKAKERILWARILREALKDPHSPACAIACATHHVDAFQRSDRLYQIKERCFDENGNFKPGWMIDFTKLYGKYRKEIADRIYHYQHCGRHSPAIQNDAFFNEPITEPTPYPIPKELEIFDDLKNRTFKHVDDAMIGTYAYYRSLKEKDDFFWPLHYLMMCPDIEDLQGVISKIFSHLSDANLKAKLGKISERFPNIPPEDAILGTLGTPSGAAWRQNIIGYYREIKSHSTSLLGGDTVPVIDPSNPKGAQGLFKLERREKT